MEALMEISSKRLGIAIVAGRQKVAWRCGRTETCGAASRSGEGFLRYEGGSGYVQEPEIYCGGRACRKGPVGNGDLFDYFMVVAGPDGKAVGIIQSA